MEFSGTVCMWFMHTESSLLYPTALGKYFKNKYPKRWANRCGPNAWPAISSDLIFPLDFYKKGQVKHVSYVT
jgi:hypothetical protein